MGNKGFLNYIQSKYMRKTLFLATACLLAIGCSKENVSTTSANPPGIHPGTSNTTRVPVSDITVLVNNVSIPVTAINFDRSGSTFNFTAQNSLQKVDVRCFWFYQQSRWNFQYSDSINYSSRADTLSQWNTVRAINYGDVNFACCYAPLTDSLVKGDYNGNFYDGENGFNVKGNFSLYFK